MSTQTPSKSTPHPVARRFADLMQGQPWLSAGDRLLVAVSGGSDSVALLALLTELAPSWRLDVRALHINHRLRGRESEEDESFVVQLCRDLGVELTIERVSLPPTARMRGGRSLQESARDARYAVLRKTATSLGARVVVLGHTADDQAETVLMWIVRGCGSRGLSGIPPIREGLFVRPLLRFRRHDLQDYLNARDLSYRSDSSNANPVYLRARIRHEVVPMLERINPRIVDTLCRQAELSAEDDRWLNALSDAQLDGLTNEQGGHITLDRRAFLALPVAAQRRVLRSTIRRACAGGENGSDKSPSFALVSAVLKRIVHGTSGSRLALRGGEVRREYDLIRFLPRRGVGSAESDMVLSGPSEMALPVPSTVRWPPSGRVVRVRASLRTVGDRGTDRGSPERAVLDADRVGGSLRIRSWQPGDAFQPAGMRGHRKKLQDFFSDLKIPRGRRGRIPLVVSPSGIVWVAGYRSDHRFRVTRATARVLILELVDRE